MLLFKRRVMFNSTVRNEVQHIHYTWIFTSTMQNYYCELWNTAKIYYGILGLIFKVKLVVFLWNHARRHNGQLLKTYGGWYSLCVGIGTYFAGNILSYLVSPSAIESDHVLMAVLGDPVTKTWSSDLCVRARITAIVIRFFYQRDVIAESIHCVA